MAVVTPVESAEAPKQEHEVVFLQNFFDELRRRVPLGNDAADAPVAERRATPPYSSSIGDADGSIIPAIMTAHMAQSSARCRASQTAVIIQALAPVIGPYMSRAITTIHIQETSGSTISSTTAGGARIAAQTRESLADDRPGQWYRPSMDRYAKWAGGATEGCVASTGS